jgi:elongator complex protein 2
MILGAAWTPLEVPTFMTAGRDKSVKIWQIADNDVHLKATVPANAAVTAVACNSMQADGKIMFAFGTENGEIGIVSTLADALDKAQVSMVKGELVPAKTINQIVWRPGRADGDQQQIAVAGDDTSLRVLNVSEEVS